MNRPRAAVDCGSNSTRLLVVDADGQRLDRRMEITRLAAGVDERGRLDDAALDRTLRVIEGYCDRWRELGVDDARVRIAATSAVRDAEDRERFLDAVAQRTGVTVEVLSGEQEAAITYAGAARAVPVAWPPAVVDIGGGSTELIVGRPDGTVAASVSLQLGCVRLTERALPGDPPGADEVEAARAEIAARLDEADARLAAQGAPVGTAPALVAVAGTATTLAALHLGLEHYEEDAIHGTSVGVAELDAITAQLVALDAAGRRALGPMSPGREDVIAAGALILQAIAHRYGFAELTASEADSLDGLVATWR